MVVKIISNDKGAPPGKLADAELHFTDGDLEGLRLVGFAVWEKRNGPGRNVTFPARAYSVNGERRSFALAAPGQRHQVAGSRSRSGAAGLLGLRGTGGGRQLTRVETPAAVVPLRSWRGLARSAQHGNEPDVLLGSLGRQRPFRALALLELGTEEGLPSCRRR